MIARKPIAYLLVVSGSLALGCNDTAPAAPPVSAAMTPEPSAAPVEEPAKSPPRARVDGSAFPDKVIALTWDDGPDATTLELAEYLHEEKVSATFFVVSEWLEGLSDEPGAGDGVLETGYRYLPILGDLVALGHRLGNHTLNHVVLTGVDAKTAARELAENQQRIDPFLTNELPLFRAPGGAWNAAVSSAVDADPSLARLVGPVHWDIDRKDWEGSRWCRSSIPAVECEHASPDGGLRVKPAVTARRYIAAIESMGHGIVLLHDRVGHVGSDYALEVARAMIPELRARGFVFAAPVLRFSALTPRSPALPEHPGSLEPADVDGDGHEDVCKRAKDGVHCALSLGHGSAKAKIWSSEADFSDADTTPWGEDASYYESLRLADLNGDGRADLCGRSKDGVVCALSTGHSFAHATLWAPGEMTDRDGSGDKDHPVSIELGDISGDGRADLCVRGNRGLLCGLAP